MPGHLVLGDPGSQEFHRLPVSRVADGADDPQALLLVLVLDCPRLHHGRHPVGPLDLRLLEDLQHVDVDEVDAELLPGHAVALHLFQDRVAELLHLHLRSGSGRALDPGVGPADVLLGDPRRVPRDLRADVALLEEHRRAVVAEEGVAQAWLEPVPARREGAGHVAAVLVVHEEQRAEAVRLHALPCTLQPVLAQPRPVDALLPVDTDHPEACHARLPRRTRQTATADCAGKLTSARAAGASSPVLTCAQRLRSASSIAAGRTNPVMRRFPARMVGSPETP